MAYLCCNPINLISISVIFNQTLHKKESCIVDVQSIPVFPWCPTSCFSKTKRKTWRSRPRYFSSHTCYCFNAFNTLMFPIKGVQSAAVNVICELARKNPRNYLSLAPIFFKLMTTSTNNWMLIKIIKLVKLSMQPFVPLKMLSAISANLLISTCHDLS